MKPCEYFTTSACRWSQTYEEGGHYSVWIHTPEAKIHSCSHSVDKSPRNAYLRKYTTLLKNIWGPISMFWIADSTLLAPWWDSDGKGTCGANSGQSLWSINWVSKEEDHFLCPHLQSSSSHPSPGTWCVLIRSDMLAWKGIKEKLFCLFWRPASASWSIVGNTLGSVEGLGRNGILKAPLSIMHTLLNNIADYVVDQTFKAK